MCKKKKVLKVSNIKYAYRGTKKRWKQKATKKEKQNKVGLFTKWNILKNGGFWNNTFFFHKKVTGLVISWVTLLKLNRLLKDEPKNDVGNKQIGLNNRLNSRKIQKVPNGKCGEKTPRLSLSFYISIFILIVYLFVWGYAHECKGLGYAEASWEALSGNYRMLWVTQHRCFKLNPGSLQENQPLIHFSSP